MKGKPKKSLEATVIIPAYNEESVIDNLLSSLEGDGSTGRPEVIVACNGCHDRTVDLVRSNYPWIICLDIKKASKTNAINEAEKIASFFPRIYMDADVTVSLLDVMRVVQYTREIDGGALVAPRASINTASSSFIVKKYYSAWKKTVFFTKNGFGSGVYVLNKEARDRFAEFPDVIADDGFVRKVVDADEVFVCASATSHVEAPRTVRDLINIKIRSKLGNMQLDSLYGKKADYAQNGGRFTSRITAFEYFSYGFVNIAAKLGANKRYKNIAGYSWQRDASSR